MKTNQKHDTLLRITVFLLLKEKYSFLWYFLFQSESLSPCLYSICPGTRHQRWWSVRVWDSFIDQSLPFSVSTLYGVPRTGRHQLLSLHLWISGWPLFVSEELVIFFSLQICRFCWNKLRTEGNGLCPACRQAYTENPADFKPLTSEEMAKIKVGWKLKCSFREH